MANLAHFRTEIMVLGPSVRAEKAETITSLFVSLKLLFPRNNNSFLGCAAAMPCLSGSLIKENYPMDTKKLLT